MPGSAPPPPAEAPLPAEPPAQGAHQPTPRSGTEPGPDQSGHGPGATELLWVWASPPFPRGTWAPRVPGTCRALILALPAALARVRPSRACWGLRPIRGCRVLLGLLLRFHGGSPPASLAQSYSVPCLRAPPQAGRFRRRFLLQQHQTRVALIPSERQRPGPGGPPRLNSQGQGTTWGACQRPSMGGRHGVGRQTRLPPPCVASPAPWLPATPGATLQGWQGAAVPRATRSLRDGLS